MKRILINNWDNSLPRDNAMYNISETSNLRVADHKLRKENISRRNTKRATSALN
jgi:hypothetical protein